MPSPLSNIVYYDDDDDDDDDVFSNVTTYIQYINQSTIASYIMRKSHG